MKKALLFVLAMAAATLANASSINVTYYETNGAYGLAGSFSGNDANNDGWLTYGELDAWNINYDGGATLVNLNDIGDFDYVNNNWVHNARQWNQVTEDAYMTWNNWGYSVSSSNYQWAFTTTVEGGEVPEPATLGLLGISLVGFAFSRRKFKA